jgi:hypothetical protein
LVSIALSVVDCSVVVDVDELVVEDRVHRSGVVVADRFLPNFFQATERLQHNLFAFVRQHLISASLTIPPTLGARARLSDPDGNFAERMSFLGGGAAQWVRWVPL